MGAARASSPSASSPEKEPEKEPEQEPEQESGPIDQILIGPYSLNTMLLIG